MINKNAFKYILLILLLLPARVAHAQHITPGSNAAYDSLRAEYSKLSVREAEMEKRLESTRAKLGKEANKETIYRNEVLKLEGDIFSVRSSLDALRQQVTEIEQAWILDDLNRGGTGIISPETNIIANPNLIYNSYFTKGLSADEWELLRITQSEERRAGGYLRPVKTNYDALGELTAEYAATDKGPKADSLYAAISSLEAQNMALADTLDMIWSDVFDTRLYLYNCALDKHNDVATISESAEQLSYLRANTDNLEGEYMYDQLTFYAIEKTFLLQYEKRIARLARLHEAADSLGKIASPAANLRSYYLPMLDTEERLFMDIAEIMTSSPAQYNSNNPIPKTEIYPKGIIYRVLLGAFTKPQPVSIFKGAYPLSCERKTDNKYYYYAGGFEAYDTANAAVAQMKKLGFSNPSVVMWENGIYHGRIDTPQNARSNAKNKQQPKYRIEITLPANELSYEVRSLIESSAPGKEISRIIDPATGRAVFTVGSFNKEAVAESLAGQIKATEKDAEVKVVVLQ